MSEIPEPESEAKASPESFSRTRWYEGRASPASRMLLGRPSASVGGQLPRLLRVLAQPVAREPTYRDLLPRLGTDLVEQRLDRLGIVLDEQLVEEDAVLEEGLELALDDPRDHVVGLAGLPRLRLEDPSLVLEGLRRDFVPVEPARRGR